MSRVGESVAGVAGLALAAAVLASILAGSPSPLLADVLFGVAPFLFLAGALVALTAKKKSEGAFRILGGALAATTLLAATKLWNDGSYYAVLAPVDAVFSILTLGFWPLHAGPLALVRFLPLGIGVGIWLRATRGGRPAKNALVGAVAAFLALAVSINALSWIAGTLGAVRGVSIATPEDAERVLITAQADGYWTRGQVERFFAPIGAQSENSFMLISAAVAFLVAFGVLLFFAIREIRGFDRLLKRLTSKSAILVGSAIVISGAIGFSTRSSASYTDALACLVFLASAASWLFAWRLTRDLANLAHDERERTDLPLPSGAASASDAILLRDACVAISLFGALLLGWPVFAGFATAFILLLCVPTKNVRPLTTALAATSLGSSALAVALRDAPPAGWMLHLVLAVGILVGLERLSRHLERYATRRSRQSAVLIGGIALSFFVASERLLWLLFLPICAAYLLLLQKPDRWAKRRGFPVLFALGAIGCIALFVPRLFSR